MAASAGEVELVDLSAADDAPAPPRGPRRRPRRRAAAPAATAVVLALLATGAWQHRSAVADQRAAARAADEQQRERAARAGANAVEHRLQQVRSANRAVTTVVTSGSGGGADVLGEPEWWPADLGPRAAHTDEPVDLQVVGTWPQAPEAAGVQRIGYRLVTGLPQSTGAAPCEVPAVRVGDWSAARAGGAQPRCTVMAAGVRGTAVRTGDAGQGASRVQVREVVLVSEGRAASVAVWSTGDAPLPLDGPLLGAAAAALLATGSPS
ncbi:hypothetical protein [Quadrisphaera sp. KR29]|uniref:hypothetical protein n=1 Tax=Quadrisphaera sp. KR29 TaxID=3461391 RepID=UPI0040444D40